MEGLGIMILCVIALPILGLLITYVIMPTMIWIGDTGKKISSFFTKKTPKLSKWVGSIMFWIWAFIFGGFICFLFLKDCSDSIKNDNSNYEHYDDAHRPDRF